MLGVRIRSLRLENEVVKAYSPLDDFIFKFFLEYLLTLAIPNLQQDSGSIMTALVLIIYLNGNKFHGLIVRTCSCCLLHFVQRPEVYFVAACFKVFLGTFQVCSVCITASFSPTASASSSFGLVAPRSRS